jgi:hypothetical protein
MGGALRLDHMFLSHACVFRHLCSHVFFPNMSCICDLVLCCEPWSSLPPVLLAFMLVFPFYSPFLIFFVFLLLPPPPPLLLLFTFVLSLFFGSCGCSVPQLAWDCYYVMHLWCGVILVAHLPTPGRRVRLVICMDLIHPYPTNQTRNLITRSNAHPTKQIKKNSTHPTNQKKQLGLSSPENEWRMEVTPSNLGLQPNTPCHSPPRWPLR